LSTISVWKSMTSSALVRRSIERLSAIAVLLLGCSH
jgi:hypothetical protein